MANVKKDSLSPLMNDDQTDRIVGVKNTDGTERSFVYTDGSSGPVAITDTTASTSTTTGALRVAGGVGIAGAAYVGGNAVINSIHVGTGTAAAPTSNTVMGSGAGAALQSGAVDNVLIGALAGDAITTGRNNTAVGTSALGATTDGIQNTAIGQLALRDNMGGTNNTAVGVGSLQNLTATDGNTALGTAALQNLTGPSLNGNNLGVGILAGASRGSGSDTLTNANNSVFIGYLSRAAGNSQSNQVVIAGINGLGNGSDTTTLGNSSTTGTFIPAGNLTLSSGNLIVASGNGIDFGLTTSGTGTMTSELLDDYEEGTFTPTVTGGVTSPTYTATIGQNGWYTKIGRMVCCVIRIHLNGGTAAATQFKFGGLPFTSETDGLTVGAGSWSYTNNFVTNNVPMISSNSASTEISLFKNDGYAFLGTDANSITGELQFTIWYRTPT